MKKIAACLVWFLASAVPCLAQGSAEPDPEIYYDLFVADSCLTAWVDLYPVLTARMWERLGDGVDIAVECRAELREPRRLWSDRLVAERARTILLSWRRLTQDFTLDPGDGDSDRTITAREEIEQYLRDSVEICVLPLARTDPDQTLRLTLRITSICLTDLNLAEKVESGNESDSPVRFLFRQFLELTDYGRRVYTVRSSPFSPAELPRLP